MGVDRNVYIGANIVIPDMGKEIKEDVFLACPSDKCELFEVETKNNFCPVCGSKTENCVVEEDEDIDVYEWLENLGIDIDYFIHPSFEDIDVVLYGNGISGIYLDDYFEGGLNISSECIESSIKAFSEDEEVKKIVEYCKDYGLDYEIKYSVVQHFS